MHNELGQAEFMPVLELFLDEVEGIVMRLSHDQPDELERNLHFLKGSAWSIGFTDFGTLCDQFEVNARKGEFAAINLDEIVNCYSGSKREFMRQLPCVTGAVGDDQRGFG